MNVKVVCISDTHGHVFTLPEGDILIHSGDYSKSGWTKSETESFLSWMESNKKRYQKIIVVPGNHERYVASDTDEAKKMFKARNIELLIDEAIAVKLNSGRELKIYGSPWTPEFGYKWAYNLPRGEKLKEVWEKIPADCQILVTHGPPWGYGDIVHEDFGVKRVGCQDLLDRIRQLPDLKLHIFGHIHSGNSITKEDSLTLVNASNLNEEYRYAYPPRVVII